MMKNKNQDKSHREDLDIGDNVGLTHDELNEIVDNIDFKEIDNLEDMSELPKEEIEAIALNSTVEQEEILAEEKEEQVAAKEILEKDDEETTYIDETTVANSLEELVKPEENINNLPPSFNEKDKMVEAREKKLVSKEKKKDKTRGEKSSKKNNALQLNSREVKELLLFLDKQLAFIPHKKIEEFVKSKYYPTYLRLISFLKH